MPPIQKKICMAGAFAVGKTSLVRRYVESIFSERYQTTVGVKIDKKQLQIADQPLTLVLWDLAGEDDFAPLRPSHLRGASGFILVVDGCRRATLDCAIELHRRIVAETGPVPFILALNKMDLAAQWELHAADIEPLLRQGWTCTRTSAKDGTGVEELFLHLATKMLGPMP
ncbi:MAG TPA: Rab family GTPase [Bryobacteraceae bacterium]|nr:Rab family GTPase [Bryobacteraceae bacterium]